ncbi:hypothetical protein [Arthrobacter pascens]|uniref:hypothetical protein n=1 Tax=Arthrobacter pascens TaxID=1677 RepID=UPI00196A51AD|nr:hypothetical protein [Arthrobacter pascens]MBN3496592.1 hypothetical protein [Arthrobacter pascens]MDR6558469.1 hypothetical protein [Arthrobacter pascens]
MSSASDARRIAAGPLPSQLVRARHATRRGHGPDPDADPLSPQTFDPLRLCIFATIALLGWAAGPAALAVFAAIGFAGYWKARRRGLTKSKCYLRDTRLVLAYLGILLAVGLWGIYSMAAQLFSS